MISATAFVSTIEDPKGFSAIARSVMISARKLRWSSQVGDCFSAIARSVMISAWLAVVGTVVIFALFQCYSS